MITKIRHVARKVHVRNTIKRLLTKSELNRSLPQRSLVVLGLSQVWIVNRNVPKYDFSKDAR